MKNLLLIPPLLAVLSYFYFLWWAYKKNDGLYIVLVSLGYAVFCGISLISLLAYLGLL